MTTRHILALAACGALLLGCPAPEGGPDAGEPDAGEPDAGQPPAMVTISGTVVTSGDDGDVPLAGATVEVVGVSPAITATSGEDGTFSLEVVEGERTIFLRAVKGGWGEAVPVGVTARGAKDVVVRPVDEADVDEAMTALGRVADPSKGVVVVEFDTPSAAGGETATLGAAHDFSFTIGGGDVRETTALLPRESGGGGGLRSLVFAFLAPGSTTVSVHGGAGATTCTRSFASATDIPVVAKTVTTIRATCVFDGQGAGRARVTGQVSTDGDPAPGAWVEVLGSEPRVAMRVDGEGRFEISAPRGVVALKSSVAGGWSNVFFVEVGEDGAGTGISGPSDAEVTSVGDAVELAYTDAKGIIVVEFDGASPFGGESAVVAAGSDKVFAFAEDGPRVTDSLGADEQTLVFAFVSPGTTAVDVTGSPLRTTCSLLVDPPGDWPVLAHTITHVRARCTPDATAPALTAVSGRVEGEAGNIPGAKIELVGYPSFTVTADASGNYSAQLPQGLRLFRVSAPGYWTKLFYKVVDAGPVGERDHFMTADAEIDDIRTQLLIGSLEGKGIVSINFEDRVHTSGQAPTISSASLASLTFDADDAPLLSATTLEGGDAFVAFAGVTPGPTTVTFTTGAGETCRSVFPTVTSWPVEAHAVTDVVATCSAE